MKYLQYILHFMIIKDQIFIIFTMKFMSLVIKNCSVYKFLTLIIPRRFVITRKIKFYYKMFLLYSFILSSV